MSTANPAQFPGVLIVASNASTRFGGEAILPWHHFRGLLERGVDVHLLVHARTRDELHGLLPEARARMHFVPDVWLQRALHRLGARLPQRLAEYTVGFAIHGITAWMQRGVAKDLVARHGLALIHEPIPVSPKFPSFLFRMGVPVLIGPMNGGMDFPPAFRRDAGIVERTVLAVGRATSHLMNAVVPGKRQAALLLAANRRTALSLPRTATAPVRLMVENGVDLRLFRPIATSARRTGGPLRFVFLGRLVELKRVDLLLEALLRCPSDHELEVVGEGPARAALEARTQELGLGARVRFVGQVSQAECGRRLGEAHVLVLPSLRECGGAVVLEAMAMGLPVIAANWGGPADYVDETTGILVDPTGPEEFVEGLAGAMGRLGASPELRERLGRAGRARVEREFDWQRKIDAMLAVHAELVASPVAGDRADTTRT